MYVYRRTEFIYKSKKIQIEEYRSYDYRYSYSYCKYNFFDLQMVLVFSFHGKVPMDQEFKYMLVQVE